MSKEQYQRGFSNSSRESLDQSKEENRRHHFTILETYRGRIAHQGKMGRLAGWSEAEEMDKEAPAIDEEAALWARAVKQRKHQSRQSESACRQFYTVGFETEIIPDCLEKRRVSIYTCKLHTSECTGHCL